MIVIVSIRGDLLSTVDPVTRACISDLPQQFYIDLITWMFEPLDRSRYIDDPIVIEVDRWLF